MSQRARRGPPVSKSRIVFYKIEGPFTCDVEPALIRARQDGIITQYDDGRGDLVWFEGPPGERLRALRNAIQACVLR